MNTISNIIALQKIITLNNDVVNDACVAQMKKFMKTLKLFWKKIIEVTKT